MSLKRIKIKSLKTESSVSQEKHIDIVFQRSLHFFYLMGFSLTMNPCYYCCPSLRNFQHSFILCYLSFANGSPYFNITSGFLISFFFDTKRKKLNRHSGKRNENNCSLEDFFPEKFLKKQFYINFID